MSPLPVTSSTRPSAPWEGQTIYETDTDLMYVYNGSSWQQFGGGTSVGNSGLVFIKAQTVGTAVSSVTVTDVFSANYENYQIIIDGGTCSTNTSFNLQLGTATSGYYYASHYSQYIASTPLGLSSTTGASFVEAGRCSTSGNNINCYLYNPFASQKTGFRSQSTDYETSGFLVTTAGFLNDTNSYTSFIIKPSSGTISGGTIRIYGYRK
jgi:hypothetical protein